MTVESSASKRWTKVLKHSMHRLDAVFYSTDQLLYHKFGNMVIFGEETFIHFVAPEISFIRKSFIFFNFFIKKGRNRLSKFDDQKYIIIKYNIYYKNTTFA